MLFDSGVVNCLTHPIHAYDRLMQICGYREKDTSKELIDFTVYGIIAFAVLEFIHLANRFDFSATKFSSKTGPQVPSQLAWFASQIPGVIIPICLLATSTSNVSLASYALIFMYLGHFLVKTFLRPFMIRGERSMALLPFLTDMAYCFVNSYIQVKYLLDYADYGYSWMLGARFILGTVLFVVGMAINLHSEALLALSYPDSDKKHDQEQEPTSHDGKVRNGKVSHGKVGNGKTASAVEGDDKDASVPTGGMFDQVTSPNYTGEILEWLGFYIAAWNLPAFAHLLLMCGSLVPRAMKRHQEMIKHTGGETHISEKHAVIPKIL